MKPEVLKSWSLETDYSRAPCLGADQKARGLWERDCGWMQPTYMRSVTFLGKFTSGSRISASRSDLLKLPIIKTLRLHNVYANEQLRVCFDVLIRYSQLFSSEITLKQLFPSGSVNI